MGFSRRSLFQAAYGLIAVLTACGDDGGKETEGDLGNASKGDGAVGGGATSDAGTTVSDGKGDSGVTVPATCTPGPCTCADGMMGFAQCEGDKLGACTCSLDLSDAGLPDVAECTGNFTCSMALPILQGIRGYCVAAADGDAGTGGMPGAGIPGVGGGIPPLPPMCATDDDCDAAGIDVKCSAVSVFGQTVNGCIQPCEP